MECAFFILWEINDKLYLTEILMTKRKKIQHKIKRSLISSLWINLKKQ